MPKLSVHISVKELPDAGEYVAKLEDAGARMLEDLAEEGASKAIDKAPVGLKQDPRTKKIIDSIVSRATRTRAYWEVVGTRHGLIIEEGGRASIISGNVSFFWDREQRQWVPGTNFIHHPPTAAKPYMKPALEEIMREWPEFARRYYP